MTDKTCAERVNEHWASRCADLERFMRASRRQCEFDDRDSDYDDAEILESDVDPEFPWVLVSPDDEDLFRTEDEAKAAQREYRISKGLDPDDGSRPDGNDVLENDYANYALCFDYVAPGTFRDQDEGYWRYQISWGGPSDEIRFYGVVDDRDRGHLYKAEYWFLDWGDGAFRHVAHEPCVKWLWQDLCDSGAARYQYNAAMEDWEPPVNDDDEEGDD